MSMMLPPGLAPPGGGGAPQVPPELLAQLGVAGSPGPPGYAADQGYGGDQGGDPLTTLRECIQQLPGVIAALPDPKDVTDATRAMLLLTQIQQRMMQPQQGAQGP